MLWLSFVNELARVIYLAWELGSCLYITLHFCAKAVENRDNVLARSSKKISELTKLLKWWSCFHDGNFPMENMYLYHLRVSQGFSRSRLFTAISLVKWWLLLWFPPTVYTNAL